jgi:hypothetical protein
MPAASVPAARPRHTGVTPKNKETPMALGTITIRQQDGHRPEIHLAAPRHTTTEQLAAMQELAYTEVLPKLTDLPACPCLSGAELHIHELFEDIVVVDLERVELMGEIGR